MNKHLIALAIVAAGMVGNDVMAHPGGLNAEGCHKNRKTGDHHCHADKKMAGAPKSNTGDSHVGEAGIAPTPEPARKENGLLRLDYEGFTLWLDCSKRGLLKYRFNAQRDTGNFKRSEAFMLDPNVPDQCQQTSAKAYGRGFDRGHGVNANALDYTEVGIRQTNFMTNILPQVSQMNRGAMYFTEMLVECYRTGQFT
jgi:endonuclease G